MKSAPTDLQEFGDMTDVCVKEICSDLFGGEDKYPLPVITAALIQIAASTASMTIAGSNHGNSEDSVAAAIETLSNLFANRMVEVIDKLRADPAGLFASDVAEAA